MEQPVLNLTRKWRSKQFKEIVGQDLVVRILQNSLFKNQFFPVYLMSGQRGCGKTSTARLFACALNCQNLSEFQKNAALSIPCLNCASCKAMSNGQHPDFIEIDAASYTGVDNIRNIIDTSSFLPVLGTRKIYLIDEVHMLSKAAFNAFLKILEEPPKFVVFILATTESQKLPDTVRSRCFQLFFNPVSTQIVVDHLKNMCDTELIAYEKAGLEMIAKVTQGSLRDAINLLEQARFASKCVTESIIFEVLGFVDDESIVMILKSVLSKDQSALLLFFQGWRGQALSIDYVIKRLIELLYDCLAIKYGANPKYYSTQKVVIDQISELTEKSSIQDLIICFDELCSIDMVLLKTSQKQLLFESLMLRLALREALQFQQSTLKSVYHDVKHDEKKKFNSVRANE